MEKVLELLIARLQNSKQGCYLVNGLYIEIRSLIPIYQSVFKSEN